MGTQWFIPGGVNQVRMFLILFCLTLALQLTRSFGDQFNYFKTGSDRVYGDPPAIFGFFRLPKISSGTFILFGILMLLSLISAALGWFPRISLAVALCCYFFYFSQIISISYVNRKTNLIPIVLIILLVSPSISKPLSDPAPEWPVMLIKLCIAQMYLSAGIQKLRKCGLKWADGTILQAYLLNHFLWGDMTAAMTVARNLALCRALSILTLLFELTFWVIIFVPALTYVYAIAGLLFHLGTLITMRINYLKYLIPVYTVFIADVVCRWIVARH
jgi:hypothetical protein